MPRGTPRARYPSYQEVLRTPQSALSDQEPISQLVPLIYLLRSATVFPNAPYIAFFFVLFFWARSSPASHTTMSSAAANPPPSQSQSSTSASQTETIVPTKPAPHGQPRGLEQPRQRRRLDPEDDETVVATPAAGSGSGSGSGSGPSSQARAAALPMPKDNDTGSEYTVSSNDDDDDNTLVPSKRSRGSTRVRAKAVRESPSEMLEPFTTSRCGLMLFFPRRSVAA